MALNARTPATRFAPSNRRWPLCFRRLDFSGCKATRRKPSSRLSDSRRITSSATGIDALQPVAPRAVRGFTLLEVLIVTVLTSMLMVGVWSLFHTWGGLYERGDRRVRKAQLVRSLCDQFTDDVRSVAYVLPPPREGKRPTGKSSRQQSPGGNRALVGGSDWMVLDVLLPPNPFTMPDDQQERGNSDSNSDRFSAPELQRVMYTFKPEESREVDSLSSVVEEMAEMDDSVEVGEEAEATASEPLSGLLRMVIPVERYTDLVTTESATGVSRSVSGLSDAAWQLRKLLSSGSEQRATNPVLGTSTNSRAENSSPSPRGILGQDKVPEVVSCQFRYYDGSGWTGSWDSRARGELPRAVEMQFTLKDPRPEEEATVESDGETEPVTSAQSESTEDLLSTELDSESSGDLTGEENESGGSGRTSSHRCVVCLRMRGKDQ